MRHLLIAVLFLPLPALAQDRPLDLPDLFPDSQTESMPDGLAEGADLMQRGMQSMLQGLLGEMQPAIDEMGRALTEIRPMAEQLLRLVDDIGNYQAPVILENGDILIRRKPAPPAPPKEGEIDL